MAHAAVDLVRSALATGQPLRASDLMALVALTESLLDAKPTPWAERRRSYMRDYMRAYRLKTKANAEASQTV